MGHAVILLSKFYLGLLGSPQTEAPASLTLSACFTAAIYPALHPLSQQYGKMAVGYYIAALFGLAWVSRIN
jgi:hypothetical protein